MRYNGIDAVKFFMAILVVGIHARGSLLPRQAPLVYRPAAYVRGVLFVGETPRAWPLWYLLALIVAVGLIGALRKMGVGLKVVWVAGLAVMGLGWAYDQLDAEALSGWAQWLSKAYRLMFATTRNGVFQGWAFVSTGMVLAHLKSFRGIGPMSLAAGLMGLSIARCCLRQPFYPLAGGAAVFLISARLTLTDRPLYGWLRQTSILVYFVHMYFVTLFGLFFGRGPEALVWIWALAAAGSVGTAAVVVALSRRPRFIGLKRLL